MNSERTYYLSSKCDATWRRSWRRPDLSSTRPEALLSETNGRTPRLKLAVSLLRVNEYQREIFCLFISVVPLLGLGLHLLLGPSVIWVSSSTIS